MLQPLSPKLDPKMNFVMNPRMSGGADSIARKASESARQQSLPTELDSASSLPDFQPLNVLVDSLAQSGRLQVRFGNNNAEPTREQVMTFLSQKFVNKDNKKIVAVEVLLNLFDASPECDGQPGPMGVPSANERYPSRYFYVLHKDLGIEDRDVQNEIMNGFRRLKMFDANSPTTWDNAWMTAKGRETIQYLEDQLIKKQTEEANRQKAQLETLKKDGIPFLNKRFLNKNFDVVTGAQILQYFIAKAPESDHRPGPTGFLKDNKFYSSNYYHLLDNDLGFEDKEVQKQIMNTMKQLGLFEFHPIPEGRKSDNPWSNSSLKPIATDLMKAWIGAKFDNALKKGPSEAKLEYVQPPVDLNKKTPEEVVNLVDFAPDVLDKIKEKLKAQGDRVEGAKSRAWLKAVFGLPWVNETKDKSSIEQARQVFNKNFYGMEPLKERLFEEIAVRNFKGGNKGGIILLWGPPGTGKTACAKTLADAMGRKFVRRSLAGISDSHKITGHDYTYVGAKHGMIVDGMMEAGTKNPVFQIDEIDKVGKNSHSGNPLDALLAVLDPQQNDKFTDSYLEVPFDLSKVLFVVTANRIEDFPAPLLSRTEVIRFDSYLPEEKVEIAIRHLIPKQYEEYNIPKEKITFERKAIEHMIRQYTLEGGVRKLEQRVKDVFRKASLYFQENPTQQALTITPVLLDQWLSNPIIKEAVDPAKTHIGKINGLYYSDAGGGTLPVEVSVSPGKGELILTGSLGNVMQEAAKVALSYIKSNGAKLDIASDVLQKLQGSKLDIHIHYPAGATPKDGPSAGSSTFTALWSALSKTPVTEGLAMTGEIDLEGSITAIGGILEKVSGSISQGVKTIYLPKANQKDFNDLCKRSEIFKKMVAAPIEIRFVSTAEELVGLIKQKAQPKKVN